MSQLFGLPQGLSGGSKETSYTTTYPTSHTTNYLTSVSTDHGTDYNTSHTTQQTTNYSTSYGTQKQTSHSTTTYNYSWSDITELYDTTAGISAVSFEFISQYSVSASSVPSYAIRSMSIQVRGERRLVGRSPGTWYTTTPNSAAGKQSGIYRSFVNFRDMGWMTIGQALNGLESGVTLSYKEDFSGGWYNIWVNTSAYDASYGGFPEYIWGGHSSATTVTVRIPPGSYNALSQSVTGGTNHRHAKYGLQERVVSSTTTSQTSYNTTHTTNHGTSHLTNITTTYPTTYTTTYPTNQGTSHTTTYNTNHTTSHITYG